MPEPFEKLKKSFPEITVRNRTDTSKDILLADGETVQVGPMGTATIPSSKMIQFPNFMHFEPVSPNTAQLVKAGVLGTGKTNEPSSKTPSNTGESATSGAHAGDHSMENPLPGADHPDLNP